MKKLIILAVLLLLILILVIPKYLRDLRTAQKKISSYTTQTLNISSGSIEYYRTGKGQPILISHGITGGFDQGLGLSKLYIGGEYDLIAVSRFGYLRSSFPKDSSPEAQADAYKELLDKLGINKTFVFGNSAGGTSAFKFAIKYPERCLGLIMVSSNVPSEKSIKLPPKPLMKVIFGSNLAYWSSVKIMGSNMLTMAGGVPKSLLADLTKQEKKELLDGVMMGGLPIAMRTKGVINDMFLSNPDINNNYSFEKIKVPVLMISAKDDTLCHYEGAQTVSEKINNVKLVTYEKGGHLILDHEKEIQKEISGFINTTSKTER